MLIIHPDFARRIDLPGAGPCPRPVDIDRSRTGFSNLVSLRIYSFAAGVKIDGEAEDDEVFIVLMRGQADIVVSSGGGHVGDFPLAADGGPRAAYLPPEASYRLTAVTDCDVAYARVQPRHAEAPEAIGFAQVGDRLDIQGYAANMDLSLATVGAGEGFMLAGRDETAPERFVHVRAIDGATATVAGERLADWDSAALSDGERAVLEVQDGSIDILTITASGRQDRSEGAFDVSR